MAQIGPYDSTLQMFVEPTREVNLERVGFVRWLVEHNRLEHGPVGPSSGELTLLRPRPTEKITGGGGKERGR